MKKRNDIKGFIPLTLTSGQIFMFNISKITDYTAYGDDGITAISFSNQDFVKVKETFDEVSELICANLTYEI